MLDSQDRNAYELLLDFHLDRLDREDREWLRDELQKDVKLRAASDRLGGLLRPLDHWTVPPATQLSERILGKIADSARGTMIMPSVERVSAGSRSRGWLFPRDMVAVAASIVLLLGLIVPGMRGLRDRSRRVACADNMASIYGGTSLYQQAFAGALPFAGNTPGSRWLPNGNSDRPYASNSRHVYLLLKLNYGPKSSSFLCPADDNGEPMSEADVEGCDDFASARNFSYSSLNMAGTSPNCAPQLPIAFLSDPNPLFAFARFDPSIDPSCTNSQAHRGGAGQTVLKLDGSVVWLTTPIMNIGGKQDNLWLAGDLRRYEGTESRASDDDAFLVPGYPVSDIPLSQR